MKRWKKNEFSNIQQKWNVANERFIKNSQKKTIRKELKWFVYFKTHKKNAQ